MAHPILDSVRPVVEAARHVRIDNEKLREVAGWMAAEDLAWPDFFSSLHPENPSDRLDLIFLYNTINFAFTDFASGEIFRVEYQGRSWSDTEAMVACLRRALDRGVPVLQGEWLAAVERAELEEIFRGVSEMAMPMLEERAAIFRQAGRRLVADFGGRFHRFLDGAPRRIYAEGAAGDGLLARLIDTFPSFRDESHYLGMPVLFQKRAQLLWWMVACLLRGSGEAELEDLDRLTAFADYIVPLGLRCHGILRYEPPLAEAVAIGKLLPRDSEEEVEIRAATVWAVHRLTAEINRLRPPELRVIEPVVDARLWTRFHRTHVRHHLTVTTAY